MNESFNSLFGGLIKKKQIQTENYPEPSQIEQAIVKAVNTDGTLLIKSRSGSQTKAFPATPSKTIGLGYEVGDNVLSFTDMDGTTYVLAYIPPLRSTERTFDHNLQRQVRPNDVLVSPERDPRVSGLSALSGSVTKVTSGPSAQSFSTPSGDKKFDIYQNYELHTNAGKFTFKTKPNMVETEILLEGKPIITIPSTYNVSIDKAGLRIFYKTGVGKASVVNSEIQIFPTGNITITSKTLINIDSLGPVNISSNSVISQSAPVILLNGGPPVARLGDKVIAGDHTGIIISGSGSVFAG